jgi:signal peptidase II
MTFRSRTLWIIVPVAAVLFLDRLTKNLAIEQLAGQPPREYAGGLLRLLYDENPGVFLGLGASIPEASRFWLFTVAVGVMLAGLVASLLFRKTVTRGEVAAFAMIIGGGTGNLIDRIQYDGVVIDFLNIGVGSVRTGVFNVADVAVIAGVLLYVVAQWLGDRGSSRTAGSPPAESGGT